MTTYNIEQYMKDLEYLVNIDCNAQNFAGIDKVGLTAVRTAPNHWSLPTRMTLITT